MAVDAEKMSQERASEEVSSSSSSAGDIKVECRSPFKWTTKWWPRIFFIDLDPFVHFGFKNRLDPQDLFNEPTVVTKQLVSNFEPAWEEEQKKEKPFVLWALVVGNVPTLMITAVLYGVSQACSLAGPLLLQKIVEGLACQPYKDLPGVSCQEKSTLYYYCIGLFLAPAIQAICENHNMFMLYRMGTRMRNTLMAAIYRKCLRLSNSSMQAESTGKVVTLMSNDAQKLQDAAFAIHAIWATPCFIIAVIVLLWFQVKWATFVGLGIMLLLVPCTGFLAGKLGSYRREILKFTEKRVGLMSEIVNGIQMIKTYAWENSFMKNVKEKRAGEARIMKIIAMWQGVFGMLMFTGPVLVSVFCFGSYTLAGNTLSAAEAYTALSYFSLLRFPLTFLPMLITMLVNALVAIRRIQSFLERSEACLATDEGNADSEEERMAEKPIEPGTVTLTGGSFTWDEAAEKPTLTNINFEARPGTLTMIVGSVGSGKSSMLAALLGHITKKEGRIRTNGSIAYVAQSAWIMNDTLQNNVLLGSEMDEKRYRNAISTSQLEPDLKIMDNGDLTEIGDRGITLSGGQKQRVSIARAVYSDADIMLLDDPLSAVDSHVGRALFETCIRGPLRSKTVVLVTNALQHLPHADQIVWMEDGTIKEKGTYKELMERGLNIAELAMIDEDDADAPDQETAHAKVDEEVAKGTAAIEKIVVHASTTKGKGADQAAVNARKSVEADRKSVDINTKLNFSKQDSKGNRNLTGEESREEGNIAAGVVMKYANGGGGWMIMLVIALMMGAEQTMGVWTNRWVGLWFSDRYDKGTGFYLGIYLLFGIGYGSTTFIRAITFLFTCVRAAVSMHNALLEHVLRLPKSFFDVNPAGRVLNRFSRDTDIMDNVLALSLTQFLNCIATYIATLIVIAIATVWFAIAIPPLTVIYIVIQRYYIPTARELQRIESVTRSPIYTKFAEAMLGMTTIRAYRKEEHFTRVSDELMEINACAFITQKLAASWLAMRLDIMGLAILTGTGALCIAGDVDPTLAGLAIMYALDLTRFLKQGTAMAAKSEADFNSVERIVQYLEPELEADPETTPEQLATMDPDWPAKGEIVVSNLQMRYRPDMPLVLKGISFTANAGDKVGLVGRTGSGKSSLLLAMLRMVEAEKGSIIIDGVNIALLGVRHLRSKVSVIPQDPFMFSGSIRHNLDPFVESTDEQLWEAVEAVGLKNVISELEGKMDYTVADNGSNFSLGQRQLFCMARAMLRRSRILMLDEATASVDLDTDNLLQTTIRIKFAECTMLTIAHRLHTIMDSDMVVVLDRGRVTEAGEPDALLQHEGGSFTSMVNQSGRASAKYLKSMARSASSMRKNGSYVRQASGSSSLGGGPLHRQGTNNSDSAEGGSSGHQGASTTSGIRSANRLGSQNRMDSQHHLPSAHMERLDEEEAAAVEAARESGSGASESARVQTPASAEEINVDVRDDDHAMDTTSSTSAAAAPATHRDASGSNSDV